MAADEEKGDRYASSLLSKIAITIVVSTCPSLNEEPWCQALAKIRRTIEIGGLLGARVVVLHPSLFLITSDSSA